MSGAEGFMSKCHKTRMANMQGTLADPEDSYGEWAFWCCVTESGWNSKPCTHVPESEMAEFKLF